MPAENDSRRSTVVVWLFGLLALGGAALLGLPRGQETPKPTQPTTDATKEDRTPTPPTPTRSRPLDVLREYLRVGPRTSGATQSNLQFVQKGDGWFRSVTISETEAGKAAPTDLAADLGREPAQYEFLIATVPDPIESKFPHEFDGVLDGIQRAFEARDFTLRASWLPWPYVKQKPQQPAASGDPIRLHREEPGVLLFARNGGLKHDSKPKGNKDAKDDKDTKPREVIALVCLVGESPISGIHKPALTESLLAQKELGQAFEKANKARWAEGDEKKTRIVGPYYSGSQVTLVRTLQEWERTNPKKEGATFEVISGSASALTRSLFQHAGVAPPRTTVIPNELLMDGVLSYLAGDRGLSPVSSRSIPHRVAFLRETNTAFGMRTGDAAGHLLGQQPIDLPFPSSISQLWAEQERTSKPLLPHAEFVEPKPTRGPTQFDAVAPYDSQTTASRAGQSLRASMATINRARVRYVGIVATDTRDVVFLNRLLQKECPNVRVFTTEPNFLLLHPEEAYHLRGMVVGSTYPLAPATQAWASSAVHTPRMIPFSMQSSHGYYNAILAQFGRTDLMLGYRPPLLPDFEQAARSEGKESMLQRPPIWISVVGYNGRLVPVHCYPDYPDQPEKAGDASYGHPDMVRTVPTEEVKAILKEKAEHVRHPANRPRVAIPVGVLLCSLGAAGALGLVLLALTVPWFWHNLAAGLTRDEMEIDGLRDTFWVWVWRGVLLASVLFFALPYTLPARELLPSAEGLVSEVASSRHGLAILLAVVISLEIVAAVVLLLAWALPASWRAGYFLVGLTLIVASLAGATWGWGAGLCLLAVLLVGSVAVLLSRAGPGPSRLMAPLLTYAGPAAILLAAVLAGIVWGVWAGAIVAACVVTFAIPLLPWWDELQTKQDGPGCLGYALLAALVVAGAALAWGWWLSRPPVERFFLYVRTTDLTAGLSPFVPMALLGATALALGWFSLQQADQARRGRLRCPYAGAVWKRLVDADEDLNRNLDYPHRSLLGDPCNWLGGARQGDRPRYVAVLLGLFLVGCVAWDWFVALPSEEGTWWDRTTWLVGWTVTVAVVLALARLLALWYRLGRLLDEILRVPMVGSYERLPSVVRKLFGGYLYSHRPCGKSLAALAWALPAESRRELAEKIHEERPRLAWVFGPARDRSWMKWRTGRALAVPTGASNSEAHLDREGRQWLAARLQEYATTFLEEMPRDWVGQSTDEAHGHDVGHDGGEETATRGNGKAVSEKEVFVAAFVATYLGGYFAQLRQQAWAVATAAPLLLFAVASYPFQPDSPRLNALLTLLGVVAVGIGFVLVQINRNGLISRIAQSTPNRFTPDLGFLSSISTYVLPILVIVLLHLLGLFRFIVEPILSLFQG